MESHGIYCRYHVLCSCNSYELKWNHKNQNPQSIAYHRVPSSDRWGNIMNGDDQHIKAQRSTYHESLNFIISKMEAINTKALETIRTLTTPMPIHQPQTGACHGARVASLLGGCAHTSTHLTSKLKRSTKNLARLYVRLIVDTCWDVCWPCSMMLQQFDTDKKTYSAGSFWFKLWVST